MADNVVETQEQISPDVQQMMEMSLKGFVPQQQTAQANQELPMAVEPTAQAQVQQVVEAKVETVVEPTFTFDILKDKFGYEKPDDVISEIEQLRSLKNNPAKPEIKFENELSEKLFKAIQSGKEDEVYKYLSEKNRLESLTSQEVNKDSAADIIKLGMQLKYKDLTPQEIDYKFNKEFALPKQPIQTIEESDEEFAEKLSEWKERVADIEMNKIIEAKLIKPELDGAKSKLVLPTLEEATDEGYAQYLKMLEEMPKLDAEVKEAYKSFVPKQIETKLKFTDEASKIDFEFQYEPDNESFKKAVELASDQDLFFNSFINSDGTPNRKGFLEFIYKGLNAERMVTEAIKQGSNARMKALLPDNSSGGLNRQSPSIIEQSELDKQMQASLLGFQKNR
jgi:hypothetical protein